VTLLGERPTLVASFGALAIVGGTFVLAMQNTRGLAAAPTFVEKKGKISRSVAYGLMVGAFIGVYTVWDKYLVSTLEVSPIVLEWALSIAIAAIVSPVALRDRRALAESWRRHKVTAIVGAAC
jgi:drug/metabolite transporter (DMT)-like permease